MNQIVSFKNRKIDFKKPVRLYRNLTKKGVWYSLVQHNLTVAHTTDVNLINCTFIVNTNARERVIRNKKKEFHAYIQGFITDKPVRVKHKVVYNPYVNVGFTCYNNDKEFLINEAKVVKCNENGVTVKIK